MLAFMSVVTLHIGFAAAYRTTELVMDGCGFPTYFGVPFKDASGPTMNPEACDTQRLSRIMHETAFMDYAWMLRFVARTRRRS